MVDTSGDVDSAAKAAAAMAAEQVAQELEAVAPPKEVAEEAAAPDASLEGGGLFAGRGRLLAALAGGLLLVGVVVVGATQLLGGPAEESDEARTQDQIVADARATLEGDDPYKAVMDLDRAIESDPENIDLYFEIGRAHV